MIWAATISWSFIARRSVTLLNKKFIDLGQAGLGLPVLLYAQLGCLDALVKKNWVVRVASSSCLDPDFHRLPLDPVALDQLSKHAFGQALQVCGLEKFRAGFHR